MSIELFLFTVDPVRAAAVVRAGAAGVVVDWEHRGKERRQDGEGTEVNVHTAQDLARVRAATPGRVLCRVDAAGAHTTAQVERAVALGADEVLLPMVRRRQEVDLALRAAAGRCGVGILVETQDAVDRIDELVRRPLSRVYVGLNDLRIDRGSTSLFAPLVDGTLDAVRRCVRVPFGVAGLTRVGGGHPVPTRLLAAELARLDASFTFLRRSFTADVATHELDVEVPRMVADVARARTRDREQVEADRAELVAAVAGSAAGRAASVA
jgi:2-keto-3-deoxy-L-rhamnonate aldolase RhmA